MGEIYILLLTCCVTRVVHLQITSSQGQHSLILAIRQFISRRDCCNLVISDDLKTFKSKEVKNYLRNNFFRWNFILDRYLWVVGFDERLIGATKSCLKKLIIARLNLQLTTISTDVEAAINSPPLTYIDDDPNNNTLTQTTSYTEKTFMKNVISTNLKILQKMMQDLVQNVQLKSYVIC